MPDFTQTVKEKLSNIESSLQSGKDKNIDNESREIAELRQFIGAGSTIQQFIHLKHPSLGSGHCVLALTDSVLAMHARNSDGEEANVVLLDGVTSLRYQLSPLSLKVVAASLAFAAIGIIVLVASTLYYAHYAGDSMDAYASGIALIVAGAVLIAFAYLWRRGQLRVSSSGGTVLAVDVPRSQRAQVTLLIRNVQWLRGLIPDPVLAPAVVAPSAPELQTLAVPQTHPVPVAGSSSTAESAVVTALQSKPEEKECSECGTTIPATTQFCPQCGAMQSGSFV